jgi:tetratricopeptide (TPR) repeat protein
MKKVVRFFLLPLLVFAFPLMEAQDHSHAHGEAGEKLGIVSFPISCDKSAQQPFERGVALLHSFWYDEAWRQFTQIEKAHPDCAMAYWGEAMTFFPQLWSRPPLQSLQQGLAVIQHAQALKAKSPREQSYINALAVFYRDYDKTDYLTRAMAYEESMERLYREYPADQEAAAFYALSLLAARPPSAEAATMTRKAVAILSKLLDVEPEHPGIAHYMIHACDTPELAYLGLPAARKYAALAPSSAHAIHMPSHIFARLGLWQEDIQSNLASVKMVEEIASSNPNNGIEHKVHALDFLEYAYLQIGEDDKAKEIVADISDVSQDLGDFFADARAHFPAVYLLETRQWKKAASLEALDGAEPHIRAITYWARSIGSGHLRDAAVAREALRQYQAMMDETRKGYKAYLAAELEIKEPQLRSWLAFAEGNTAAAIDLMRSAAERQELIGHAEVDLTAREMLADMLLEASRPQEALIEYEKSLKKDPNRFNGLYGAARAAEASNQPEKATAFYSQLLKNCANSTSARPELAHARLFLSRSAKR